MLFLLINETKSGLTEEDYRVLKNMMGGFYSSIPQGVRLIGDYATLDKKKAFALLEAESIEKIEEIKAPFEKYVNIEIIPVEPTEPFKMIGSRQ